MSVFTYARAKKPFLLWTIAVAIAAALLVATNYRSRDPDSSLYARISIELAAQPAHRWIAPEWWGGWDNHGPFKEHPIGIFILPVLLIRMGFPPAQAAYVVNMLCQVAVILLIPAVASVFVRAIEARSLAWLLQLLPVAFTYRIRANQEHPTLMCFLGLLYATDRARQHPAWIALMIVSFCFLVLIKGVFALFAFAAAALWLLLAPAPPHARDSVAWAGLGLTVVAAVLMMAGYEAWYRHATGESFLAFYASSRVAGNVRVSGGILIHALTNAVWYVSRLLWFAFPCSLATAGALWLWLRSKRKRSTSAAFDAASERGVMWMLLLVAVHLALLSPATVRAERFVFPMYFIVGAVGVVAATRRFDGLARVVARLDGVSWLPVAIWLATFLLSLGSRLAQSGVRS
jgi:Dolichyl-phosphate-mannose-protein mannosyltransferase